MTDSTLERVALKPCPFCGGEVERVFPPCSDLSEYIRHKGGGQCPVEFTAFYLDDDISTLWNTRPEAADTICNLVEALTEARKRLDRECEFALRKEREDHDDKFREGYADGVTECWNHVVPLINATLSSLGVGK